MVKRTFFTALFSLGAAWLLSGAVVSASFLAQASAGGMMFRSLSVDLEVSNSSSWEEPPEFFPEVSLQGATDLIPGGPERSEVFWVKNISSSPRALRLVAQFIGNSEPSVLDELVEIRVVTENTPQVQWQSLGSWAANGYPLENGILFSSQARRFELQYRLLPRYPGDPDGDGALQAQDLVGEEIAALSSGPWTFALRGNVQEAQ